MYQKYTKRTVPFVYFIGQNDAFGQNFGRKVFFILRFHDTFELTTQRGVGVGGVVRTLQGDDALGVFSRCGIGLGDAVLLDILLNGLALLLRDELEGIIW